MPYSDPEKRKAYAKKYREENYERHYSKRLAWRRNKIKGIREQIFNRLGGTYCKNCGFDDPRALCLDHINGGGNKHRKQYTMLQYYYSIQKMSDQELLETYQVLCANCNTIKKLINREAFKEINRNLYESEGESENL